jgi:peptidylprolyl isomerase
MKYKLLLSVALVAYSVFAKAQTEVTFYTSKGIFVASMEQTKRPITTTNFLGLVNNKFYDGIIFHRVVAGFVIQGGDPTGTGSGGSGVTIIDELVPVVSNVQKTISMANSGPNTGTSQFFINLVNNTGLDPNYPCFGTVISGFSVVQTIGAVAVNANDRPLVDVVMDSVRVTKFPTSVSSEAKKYFEMEVFPNPAVAQSMLSINAITSKEVFISVYNESGVLLHRMKKNLVVGINSFSFSDMQIDNFAKGIYSIVVNDGDIKTAKQVIKIN